jgi:methenyltetrahydrofolate cyclohydrolase
MRKGDRPGFCTQGKGPASSAGKSAPMPNRIGVETLEEYLAGLASEWPTPGGGSAAAVVAAAGAALIAMVARISATNPKYAPHAALARELVTRGDALREECLRARERDEAAYDRVVAATAMPQSTEAEQASRRAVLERALENAAAEPLSCAEMALEVMRLASRALEIPNKNVMSDVGCAAEFAAAAIASCAYNVRINHRFMHDIDAIEAQAHMLERIERESAALSPSIRRVVNFAIK